MTLAFELNEHYSDLMAQGSLVSALNAELAARRIPLTAEESAPSPWTPVHAFIFPYDAASLPLAYVYLLRESRSFLLGFCRSLTDLTARGQTDDLGLAAEAIRAWTMEEESVAGMRARFACVKVLPKVAYREGSASEMVAQAWSRLQRRVSFPNPVMLAGVATLEPLLQKVLEIPALRQLYPYISFYDLRFSRCTEVPYTSDCPFASPVRYGYYKVCQKEVTLGEGDAVQAARLLVENLPPGCGPAILGTADDLQ